jgi:hypothetical protein
VHEQERGRAEHAVRRPVDGRRRVRCVGDHVGGTLEVGPKRTWRAAEQQHVPVAVDRDLVTGSRDLSGERRQTLDLLADKEERRARAATLELLENGGRSLRVRTVVEGDRDPSG